MASEQEDFENKWAEATAHLFDNDAVTPVHAVAMAQFDCAKVFQETGFERPEALYLVAAMFCGNPGIPPGT